MLQQKQGVVFLSTLLIAISASILRVLWKIRKTLNVIAHKAFVA